MRTLLSKLLARLRAWWDWLCDPTGELREDDRLHAISTAELARVRILHVDHRLVGRQESEGAAIQEIATWLEVNGFADLDAGERQRYACWLRAARASHEAGGVREDLSRL